MYVLRRHDERLVRVRERDREIARERKREREGCRSVPRFQARHLPLVKRPRPKRNLLRRCSEGRAKGIAVEVVEVPPAMRLSAAALPVARGRIRTRARRGDAPHSACRRFSFHIRGGSHLRSSLDRPNRASTGKANKTVFRTPYSVLVRVLLRRRQIQGRGKKQDITSPSGRGLLVLGRRPVTSARRRRIETYDGLRKAKLANGPYRISVMLAARLDTPYEYSQ